MEKDRKIKVGILRGGEGEHHFFSLRKGGDIISHIFENLSEKYKHVDIFVDKKNNWHINGILINPMDLISKVDILWNTSKNPALSSLLNNLSLSNINNGSFFKTLENNTDMLHKHIRGIGIKMPRSILLPLYQKDFDGKEAEYVVKKATEVLNKFGAPWIVKSFTEDKNMGIHLAKTFPELVESIRDGVAHKKSILIEEFISGKIASVHSVPGFRGEDVYTFPLVNTHKDFLQKEKEELFSLVKSLHNHLGIDNYLKSDFVLHPKRGYFLLSIDSLPDPREESHLRQSCDLVGAKMEHVFNHILERALNKKVL